VCMFLWGTVLLTYIRCVDTYSCRMAPKSRPKAAQKGKGNKKSGGTAGGGGKAGGGGAGGASKSQPSPLFEARKKNYGIGGDITPKGCRDLTRCVYNNTMFYCAICIILSITQLSCIYDPILYAYI